MAVGIGVGWGVSAGVATAVGVAVGVGVAAATGCSEGREIRLPNCRNASNPRITAERIMTTITFQRYFVSMKSV
ncbi:MAG TPA: hypothetical protein DF911_01720 [Erysipelotrichaceae bacterium]|nr:hypothetical protein [Erysipelotrichaceae bacterium]